MSNLKHQSIIYSTDSKYDNYIDPITRNPFKNGEQVVVCKEKNSLLASRSLKANNSQCPFCGKQLNSDLTIEGPIIPPNSEGKEPKRPHSSPPTPPSRSNISPILWIGLAVVLIFCFILTVSGVFAAIIGSGGTSNPSPVSSTIRPTSTKSYQAPRSTNTPNSQSILQPTTPPKNSKRYAEISCAEIHKVNLRRTPGYVGKNDNDSLYEIPCGEFVELLGQTQKADGLTWWNVYWNGYTGWIADHTGSGKIILDFNP
ncbi:MAG: hypothetical protein KA952_08605 [Sediminibacterium sp.]|nr:hypothetical protein [Sediminibacterium sp.]